MRVGTCSALRLAPRLEDYRLWLCAGKPGRAWGVLVHRDRATPWTGTDGPPASHCCHSAQHTPHTRSSVRFKWDYMCMYERDEQRETKSMCVYMYVFTLKSAKVLTQYEASSTVSSTETCMRPYVSVPRLGQYWSHLFCTEWNSPPSTPHTGVWHQQNTALLHHTPPKVEANYQELLLNFDSAMCNQKPYIVSLWEKSVYKTEKAWGGLKL